jgi:hypothetical protein
MMRALHKDLLLSYLNFAFKMMLDGVVDAMGD